ncbi:MAG: hypothetical protein ABI594_16205 [Ginsengibacter sp.]
MMLDTRIFIYVSTTIKEDGTRINTHNIGRNQSEKARREIEQLYDLVKAEEQQKFLLQKINPVDIVLHYS